jgi:NAD(P)-dependent dehydrogenase (short-subunit alcohol dehydrogenase family)
LQLARDGAEVLVHGRNAARGAETVQEITDAGGKPSFVAADLGDAAVLPGLTYADIGI